MVDLGYRHRGYDVNTSSVLIWKYQTTVGRVMTDITSLRMVNVSRKPSIHTAASYSFGQPEESITDHVSANNRHLFLRALKAEKFQIKPTADVEPVKGSLPYSSIVVLFIFVVVFLFIIMC